MCLCDSSFITFQAVMYDRLAGSTTMIISSSGTTVPGSPIRPEYLKASVYLPPAFVAHHPDLHSHIIDIVQQYIETVGVRTVDMWTQRARHDLNYTLTQRGNPRQNADFKAIPTPDDNSAHYSFLGQPNRFVQDPSSTSVRDPSQDGSVDSYDFGEDPDSLTLLNVDLQLENRELQDQINILQHKIADLERQVNLKRAQDQIDLRYEQTTPSRIRPHRALTPSDAYRNPGPQNPETPSRRQGASSVSCGLHLGNSSESCSLPGSELGSNLRTVQVSAARDGGNAEELAPVYEPLLRQYIDLYNLHHIAAPLDLIFNYTPVGNRIQELLKLGLGENVCDALAKAMDNGVGLSSSGIE